MVTLSLSWFQAEWLAVHWGQAIRRRGWDYYVYWSPIYNWWFAWHPDGATDADRYHPILPADWAASDFLGWDFTNEPLDDTAQLDTFGEIPDFREGLWGSPSNPPGPGALTGLTASPALHKVTLYPSPAFGLDPGAGTGGDGGGGDPGTLRALNIFSSHGTVTTDPGGTSFADGAVVTLTAVPAAGYAFANWSGDASGTTNPLAVTMDTDKTITGVFEAAPTFAVDFHLRSGPSTGSSEIPTADGTYGHEEIWCDITGEFCGPVTVYDACFTSPPSTAYLVGTITTAGGIDVTGWKINISYSGSGTGWISPAAPGTSMDVALGPYTYSAIASDTVTFLYRDSNGMGGYNSEVSHGYGGFETFPQCPS